MNFSDLFVVVALVSGLYAVLVALTGRRQFLVTAVNPHRLTWLIAAVSVLWVGLSLMRWEAQTWELATWGRLITQLVTDAPTPARVKVASVAILFGLLLMVLVAWCVIFFPRAPSTFTRPNHRRAAFRYYVSRLGGGIDYALLAHGDGEVLEEEANLKQIQDWCGNLPKVKVDDEPPRTRSATDQAELWRRLAAQVHARMSDLDRLIEPAHQGHNRRLVFDCEYGGLFFRYIRPPDPTSPVDTGLFLFGATLSQVEMDNGRAGQQFQLLLDALKHIERSVRVT